MWLIEQFVTPEVKRTTYKYEFTEQQNHHSKLLAKYM